MTESGRLLIVLLRVRKQGGVMADKNSYIRWFENLSSNDVPLVGGKNASLGEMVTELKKERI